MLLTNKDVKRDFLASKELGRGGDGQVNLYVHRRISDRAIAVKIPVQGSVRQRMDLRTEINNAKQMTSNNVISLFGWSEHWVPYGPALFYEFCELGDLFEYPKVLRRKYGFIPEETLWKAFADVSKGLNHMHNELNFPLVHGDLKPDNILVARPIGCHDEVPMLPTFKIADLARAAKYHPACAPINWYGTYEFAPPKEETSAGATPAADIWSLGATIQCAALGILPVQSHRDFKAAYKLQWGIDLDAKGRLVDFECQAWRELIPVIHRPLNATPEAHKMFFDWPDNMIHDPATYSTSLNRWYTMCFVERQRRITADDLVKWLLPVAEHQIKVLQAKRRMDEARKAVRTAQKAKKSSEKQSNISQRHLGRRPAPRPSEAAFSIQATPPAALRREDFGLRSRPARELLRGRNPIRSDDSNELHNLRHLEQKYLRGMKKPG